MSDFTPMDQLWTTSDGCTYLRYGWLVGGGDDSRLRFAPGVGQYQLLDYTLVLRYGDGRVVAFSCRYPEEGEGDPAVLTIKGCRAARR